LCGGETWTLKQGDQKFLESFDFWYVVLEKDEEDQMDWSCEKWRSITWGQGEKEFATYNKQNEG
jgi:hypothetical protein